MRNPGKLVKTKSGKTGRTYDKEAPVDGKIRVHVINDDMDFSGDKLLCDPESLEVIGLVD